MNEYIYTDSKGKEMPVSKITNSHLLNALLHKVGRLTNPEGLTVEEGEKLKKDVEALKVEVLRRMPIQ